MILNKYKFYNTLNQEIEMLPIATFLFDYPDYGKHLAEVVESWAKDSSQISATRIQRKCMIRYEVADAMLEAFLCSRIAIRLHEPARVELCLDDEEANRISRFIIESVENRTFEEDKWLLQDAMKAAFDFYNTPKEEKQETPSEDFYIEEGCLRHYKGNDADLKIPEGVKIINRFAFKHSEFIKNVSLPIGLCEINQSAFRGCINLEYVSLPHTLKRLGSTAFMDCRSLREITIPDSVERIYDGAFAGCTSLSKIRISENLDYLPNHIFFGCKSIEAIRIPDSVSIIGFQAFGECDNLKLAYVPRQTQIEDKAFPEHTEIIRI